MARLSKEEQARRDGMDYFVRTLPIVILELQELYNKIKGEQNDTL